MLITKIGKLNKMKLFKKNRKSWILYSMSTCLAMLNLNSTAVMVILPSLYNDLGMDQVMQQWVINSYLLPFSILMVLGGKISDIFGIRRAFLFGLSGFLVASIFCGLANTIYLLLLGRVFQGMFGAVLIANTIIVILSTFPKNKGGTVIGIYVGISSPFLALGPLLGGFCTQFLSWHYVFWLNLPLGLFSFLTAFATLPWFKNKVKKTNAIDWWGFLLLIMFSSSLLIIIMEGINFGWQSPRIIGLSFFCISTGIFFIFFERRCQNPLIDFNLFREKNYLFICIIVAFIEIGMITRIFWVLFLQVSLDYSPITASLVIMPSITLCLVFSPLSGHLLDKYGPRLSISIGLALLFIGLLWISLFVNLFNLGQIIFGTILSGMGLAMSSGTSVIVLAHTPKENKGVAYAIYQQIRQFGGALGMAIIGAVVTNLNTYYFNNTLANLNSSSVKKIAVDTALLITEYNSDKNFSDIPENLFSSIHDISVMAYAKAFSHSMLIAAILIAIALYLSITKIDKKFFHHQMNSDK